MSHMRVYITIGDKEFYAIKCQLKSAIVENDLKKHVLNEINLMKKVNHPFINKLYAATQDDYYLYFFLELLPGNISIHLYMYVMERYTYDCLFICIFVGGELFSHLQTVGKVTENDAKFYSGAVVSAFTHLHQSSLRIAYRDLKPENIVSFPIDEQLVCIIIASSVSNPVHYDYDLRC